MRAGLAHRGPHAASRRFAELRLAPHSRPPLGVRRAAARHRRVDAGRMGSAEDFSAAARARWAGGAVAADFPGGTPPLSPPPAGRPLNADRSSPPWSARRGRTPAIVILRLTTAKASASKSAHEAKGTSPSRSFARADSIRHEAIEHRPAGVGTRPSLKSATSRWRVGGRPLASGGSHPATPGKGSRRPMTGPGAVAARWAPAGRRLARAPEVLA